MTCADDDNRIVLKPIDQHESDYVNASYVDVSTHPLAYSLIVYTPFHYPGSHHTKEVHCHSRCSSYVKMLVKL